jgi:hypothetical protein
MTRRELEALSEGDRVLVRVESDGEERWDPAMVVDPLRGWVLCRGREWIVPPHDIRLPKRAA